MERPAFESLKMEFLIDGCSKSKRSNRKTGRLRPEVSTSSSRNRKPIEFDRKRNCISFSEIHKSKEETTLGLHQL